jgi:hypothetical protein
MLNFNKQELFLFSDFFFNSLSNMEFISFALSRCNAIRLIRVFVSSRVFSFISIYYYLLLVFFRKTFFFVLRTNFLELFAVLLNNNYFYSLYVKLMFKLYFFNIKFFQLKSFTTLIASLNFNAFALCEFFFFDVLFYKFNLLFFSIHLIYLAPFFHGLLF